MIYVYTIDTDTILYYVKTCFICNMYVYVIYMHYVICMYINVQHIFCLQHNFSIVKVKLYIYICMYIFLLNKTHF